MELIKVTGRLRDFNGTPLAEGDVRFYDENFETLYSTKTNVDGTFELFLENRTYPSVFICQSYKEKYLEYWHWNFNPQSGSHLDVQIDGLELYGIKAWETSPTYPGLMVFFRPMSLAKFKALGNPPKGKPVLIAPDLSTEDVMVEVDGKPSPVLGINRVKEFVSTDEYLDAYMISTSTAGFKKAKRVVIRILDRHTQEKGMAGVDLAAF
ncbi:carboxypeptidase-like regulatory domain-containing protein [Bdellovibrio sp. GT3]|uniref:carboxypeptidase-like regulatory domain-containing protein n=1 Tax=Bdellovibrio sp. GT3 TaxID=3136282 RepID=UPI0030F38C7F